MRAGRVRFDHFAVRHQPTTQLVAFLLLPPGDGDN